MPTIPRLILLVLFLLTCLSGTSGRAADPPPYKPGDKVEYRVATDQWELGIFVKLLPGGTQAVIREKPNQFFKDGFERAYSLDAVRIPGTAPKPGTAPGMPVGKPGRAPAAAGPPMSEQEVLSFLAQRLGDKPFENPDRDRVKQELGELIKARGVNFHYQAVSPFSNELSKYGATSDITFPLIDNYGPPTKASFYPGGWDMVIIGAPFDFVRGDKLFRQSEIGAKAGYLTIGADRTYVWKLYHGDPPAKHVRGKWREATIAEMKYEGGAGLVLLKAKAGWDWIVTRDRATLVKGQWIRVAELGTRQVREFGVR
jgi:hypothetical protein